ncbi:hypothetical protein CW298_1605 [Salmonella enterica subsp. enterica serovar Muenchen]|nr:hypothetical protein CW298_1605 [Salmonella enterica subsp. enterica serovar Muenchen]
MPIDRYSLLMKTINFLLSIGITLFTIPYIPEKIKKSCL